MSSKVLLVFCDGTGMDGNLAGKHCTDVPQFSLYADRFLLIPEGDVGSGIRHVSNVLRLSRAVKQFTSDGRNQVVFYQSGVGSETDFQGNPVLGRMGALMQQYTNRTLRCSASKIGDVYAFIAQNFEPKDDICIFGVAYTARVVADLIDQIGLLCLENLGHFFSIWRQLLDGKEPTIPEGTRWTPIKCVGVWDTICSVPKDRNAARSRNTDLPASVDIALHALSLHENRDKFRPKLWTVPKHGLAPRGMDGKQVWFPGAHSDVGGGYERHELADISLFWMAGEVCDFINLDLEFIQRSAQRSPEPWGKSQPHNAWKEAPWHFKRFIHSETRLQSHDIKQDALFHSSVLVSPTTVRKAQNMITSKTLRKRFGERWKPRIVELNSFEKRCKTDWEEPPVSAFVWSRVLAYMHIC
ncbi:uncharacterized protein LAESUDRAFT_650380 [Laetiporus sulphureus 93-53]|uniref:T6SS Phospholipase effector Tle1-like catalytic domain-containing protein n=1 Tax=Laetiporus sulphureus 93-53 TaxID=1314785 RepID=A0A165EXZ8_9APHY|nr:uncharacterized protein LAESUDRAFT_650380 [Laetiporus sulphureus 93-53]KZT07952.1 hypothetical protein LAESUDRAFT_650380 [Laetiporus sulphureus 93-53]